MFKKVFMDYAFGGINIGVLICFFLGFIGLSFYIFRPKAKKAFEEHAKLPLFSEGNES